MVRWLDPKNLRLPRMKAARLAAARVRRKTAHEPSDKKRTAWEFGELYWGRIATLVRNGLATLIVGFGVYIVYQSVTQKVISIAPMSVPKELVDDGFTADVAAERLRDALNEIVSRAPFPKGVVSITGQTDQTNIVVPSTSLSTEILATQIRHFFQIESHSNVSGEITRADNQLWLRLRRDGRDIYSSPSGVDPKRPDDLFAAGAEKIFELSHPFILALSFYDMEPDKCLEKARHIIDSPPENPLEAWSRIFMIGFLLEKIGLLDHSEAWAHTLAGNVFMMKKFKFNEAITEYQKAIKLDPLDADPHNNLGLALSAKGQTNEAIDEFNKAIKLDPRDARPHSNLGNILNTQGKTGKAIAEFRRAIELDQHDPKPHNNLAIILQKQGKTGEAIAEYQKAMELDPRLAAPHNNLAVILKEQGKAEEAMAEEKKARELEKKP